MNEATAARGIFAAGLCEGERWLITGGGTGIGLSTARLVLALGGKVAILGRRPEVLAEAEKSLDAGPRVVAVPCDIREPDRVSAAVEAAVQGLGGVDVLVNNAGGQFPATAESISPRGFEAVIRNNLLGTWYMTREVATRCLIPQERGSIVNVIAQVERGFPGMSHTGAARAGVENLTRSLAIEWVRYGIRVNALAPGYIKTTGTDQYGPELLERVRQLTPMKRLGTPEEIAEGIVYLASRAGKFITGITHFIDGGARLWGETWPIPEPGS